MRLLLLLRPSGARFSLRRDMVMPWRMSSVHMVEKLEFGDFEKGV
jgi:hypothetical protein